jgi:aminopeptidase-like protein
MDSKLLESIHPESLSYGYRQHAVADNMHGLMTQLYPICRSITGDGVRQTLKIIKEHIPLQIEEVPSGTGVFDWTVPKEWNIYEAYIKDSKGKKIIDFKDNNLHVMSYSIPMHKKMALADLKNHLYTLSDHPEWIPYRTSYYKEDWGFCMTHNQFVDLEEGEYEVFINSTLQNGSLTYGELLIKGDLEDEVLISTHICHPSMCNDNLSGVCLATFLAKKMIKQPLRYSYRFLFVPGTIGAITWLAKNEEHVSFIKHGLVASLLGDSGRFTYKKSRRGNAEIDKVVSHALKNMQKGFEVIDFSPYGYDERQYCSPGFDLPVGSLTRTQFAQFPEYHTSADNLSFVTKENLEESLEVFKAIINLLENNRKLINLKPKCEPQLGKYGLYNEVGGNNDALSMQMAFLWLLSMSDGDHTLMEISEKSGYDFYFLNKAARLLEENNLLKEVH